MTRAIFGPTFEEMLHPSAIDPAMRAWQTKRRASDKLAAKRRNEDGGMIGRENYLIDQISNDER